jgi:hypothetical protein
MDLMGLHALMHSWSLVLAGKDSEFPTVLGTYEDPMVAALEDPSAPVEEFKLEAKRLTGKSLLQFGAQFLPDPSTSSPIETRTVCLPKKFVEELRQQAMAELTAEHGKGKDTFISEADTLTAWAVRAIASASSQPRPATAFHAMNMRFHLPCLINASGVYVRNMAVGAFVFVPPETAVGGLGRIASANRGHLLEQSTIPQVLAYMRELTHNSAYGADSLLMFGDPNALLVPFTNWTKADFAKTVDFSPAVVHGQGTTSEGRSNPPGSLTFHHIQSLRPSAGGMNTFVIMGKDHCQNYWVTATLQSSAWEMIRKSFSGIRGSYKHLARL